MAKEHDARLVVSVRVECFNWNDAANIVGRLSRVLDTDDDPEIAVFVLDAVEATSPSRIKKAVA